MTDIRFETFDRLTLFGRRYFFRIVRNGNSEPMAQSEAYNRAAPRDIAIGIIQEGASSARVRAR
jgi:uncharacterized protein YegP (UPF0339 family)